MIHRLDVGGLENGLVNLINWMPADRFRHAIVCLTEYSDFRDRIRRNDVALFALHKPPGNSPLTLIRLWSLLRKLRPAILHTRNLSALDGSLAATLASVRIRIHGEHGRDMGDLDGSNTRYQTVRRLFKPFVHQYVALSKDLERYLRDDVGVPQSRILQLYNGVDTELFHPATEVREVLPRPGFAGPETFVIGTVGRMQAVKDQLTLARAFILVVQRADRSGPRPRLVMIGDGPLLPEARRLLAEAGVAEHAWLPGARDDVARIMRGLDLFVLPSLAEGVSNTILEAMASGLPVVATAVGGNPELIEEGRTGRLVPAANPEALAEAILQYQADPAEGRRQGREARAQVERKFSMTSMMNGYLTLYERLLERRNG